MGIGITSLYLASDLHLEFQPPVFPLVPGDAIVVLAGDIDRALDSMEWAVETFQTQRIVMVAGNHEHYRGHVQDDISEMSHVSSLSEGRVSYLENSVCEAEGYTFLGCTLWGKPTERDIRDERYSLGFTDFVLTRCGEDRHVMRYRDVWDMHDESVAWLESELGKHDPDRTVVVTHNTPHPGCGDPQYAGDAGNWFFTVDLGGMIERHQPRLWLCGHTHYPVDYSVGRTRIVNNPRAYRHEAPYSDFHFKKIDLPKV